MIRPAVVEDIARLAELAGDMVAESDYKPFGVDVEKFTGFITPLIANGFVAVKEVDGLVVGAMLGDVVAPWFTTKRMGIEHAIYISPKYRNGLTAARLITEWIGWCKANGAVQCRAGISTGNMAVASLYERFGFKKSGTNFILDF
jgi:L-amino acid N-acyltransferase YncA